MCNGATPSASIAHSDATFRRIRGRLTARPAAMRLGPANDAVRGAEGDDVRDASIVAGARRRSNARRGGSPRASRRSAGRFALLALQAFAASSARTHLRRGLLHAVVALRSPSAISTIRRWSPSSSAPRPRCSATRSSACGRCRSLLVGALPALIALHRLAAVPLGRDGGARGPDVDRDAAGHGGRGVRDAGRAARRLLDAGARGARRAVANRQGAMADRDRRRARAACCSRNSPPLFSPPASASPS